MNFSLRRALTCVRCLFNKEAVITSLKIQLMICLCVLLSCSKKEPMPPALSIVDAKGNEVNTLFFDSKSVEQSIFIKNKGEGELQWVVDPNFSPPKPFLWMFDAYKGSGDKQIKINTESFRNAYLATGQYAGYVDVSSNGGNKRIDLQYAVGNPKIGLSRNNVTFGADKDTAYIYVANKGEGILTWDIDPASASWLKASVYTLYSNGARYVAMAPIRNYIGCPETPGNYNTSITFKSNGGDDIKVPVSIQITNPILDMPYKGYELGVLKDITSLGCFIVNKGQSVLTWNAVSDKSWLKIKANGSGKYGGTINYDINPAGLSAGTYKGNITVTSNGGTAVHTVSFKADGSGTPTQGNPGSGGSGSTSGSRCTDVGKYVTVTSAVLNPNGCTTGSMTVHLKNSSNQRLNAKICLQKKDGSWDCGVDDMAANGGGTFYWTCNATGRYVYYGMLYSEYEAKTCKFPDHP